MRLQVSLSLIILTILAKSFRFNLAHSYPNNELNRILSGFLFDQYVLVMDE
jgi:hypothetical protein